MTIIPKQLSQLEHYLLGHCSNGIEPMWVIYMEARRDFKDCSQPDFVDALVFLADHGLLNATFDNDRAHKWEPIVVLTREQLFGHMSGRSESELVDYPSDQLGGEYHFEIRDSGRAEESKDEYSHYYPNDLSE